jgi:hypothetical protein
MSAEATMDWMRAELAACSALVSVFTANKIVRSDLDALPSTEGVFIAAETEEVPENFADTVSVRIIVCRKGTATQCNLMMREVRKCLEFTPGFAKSWAVTPSTKGLKLRMVKMLQGIPAGKAEKEQDFNIAMWRVRVFCKSLALPA